MAKPSDSIVDSSIKQVLDVHNTVYPFNLGEREVVRLIYFFGARKASTKYSKKGNSGGTGSGAVYNGYEEHFLKDASDWFKLKCDNLEDQKKVMTTLAIRFKVVLMFLRARPGFITKDIFDALETGGYKSYTKAIVLTVDGKGGIQPKVMNDSGNKDSTPPIARAEMSVWELQNTAMDKMQMILQSVTMKDVKKANLGMKSKALRDIFTMFHMSKSQNKNPNLTLVNVNVGESNQKTKLNAYNAYLSKNREDNK